MGLIREEIPNLVNGVSQQSPALRLLTQLEAQRNGYSTLVNGLTKRPPTNHKAQLFAAGTVPADSTTHIIDRDDTEKYAVNVSNGSILVSDFAGVAKTVNAPGGYGYLPASDFKKNLRLVTNADYTFFINLTKVTEIDTADKSPVKVDEALVHIISGNYGKMYKIKLNGTEVASYETPPGDNAKQSPAVATEFIAKRLVGNVDASGNPGGGLAYTGQDLGDTTGFSGTGGGTGHTFSTKDKNLYVNAAPATWTIVRIQSVIHIKRVDGAAFTCAVEDGFGGKAMKAITGDVQAFSDLPNFAPLGYRAQVQGTDETNFDNFYVEFKKDGSSSSAGYWQECIGPNTVKSFKSSTMPHVLVREADGTFTFKPFTWDEREAGDDESNPFPSFIGFPIRDIFFWRKRLGMLALDRVIASASSDLARFFRTTATALLDDDPFDSPVPSSEAVTLDYGVPLQGKLLLCSSTEQFILKADQIASPKTISIESMTKFEASNKVRPVVAGKFAYFPLDRGNYTALREYFFDEAANLADANDITSHVPSYIPSGITAFASSTHEDLLFAYSNASSKVYPYKYFWSGDDKLQASWSEWDFADVTEIMVMFFIRSSLYAVFRRTDNKVYLEEIKCNPGLFDDYVDHTILLDRRIHSTELPAPSYNGTTNQTTYTLPFKSDGNWFGSYAGSANPTLNIEAGSPVTLTKSGDYDLIASGDTTAYPIYFGTKYTHSYRFSRFYVRESSQSGNGGSTVIAEGRLQILRLALTFAKTAFFRVEVSAIGKAVRTMTFTGRPRSVSESGKRVYLEDGSRTFSVLSKNDRVTIDVINDSHLPSSLLSAEWIGQYNPKARGL